MRPGRREGTFRFETSRKDYGAAVALAHDVAAAGGLEIRRRMVVDGTVYWGYGFALLGSGSGQGGLYALRPTGAPDAHASPGTAPEADLGAEVYRTACSSCHGTRGQGAVGPDLHGVVDRLTLEEHLAVVRDGRGTQMPSFEGTLTDEEIAAVVEHERSLPDADDGG